MRSALFFFFLTISFICISTGALAATADGRKIGLALSGGGARGAAHIGVLRSLEELGIKVDYIAGTSMGSVIGGLYAAGYSPDEIERLMAQTDWQQALSDSPHRRNQTMRQKDLQRDFAMPTKVGLNHGKLQLPLGVVAGQHLDQIFQRHFMSVRGISDFDQLAIPFRAIATDLVTGEEVILAEGSLPDAVRASMSVPGIFAPVQLRNRLLVDGGMANNLPISVVRAMGADIVIAVDISSPLLGLEELDSVVNVSLQLTNFLTRRNTAAQIATLGEQDLLIVPELGDLGSADFKNYQTAVDAGYQAAIQNRPQLAVLAGSNSQRVARTPPVSEPEYIVHFIELDNDSVLADQIIESRVDVEVGKPLNFKDLERSLDQIYALDVFSTVTYDLVNDEQGQSGVRIEARKRSWGSNYLQFLLELSDDFKGDSDYQMGAAYTRSAVNSLGGELRLEGSIGRVGLFSIDFYQPIDNQARWFIEPELFKNRQSYNVFLDGKLESTLEIKGLGTRLGLGRNYNSRTQLRMDYEYFRGDANTISGSLPFPIDKNVKIGDLTLQAKYDSMDNFAFPTQGAAHTLAYLFADNAIGAGADYQQAFASGSMAWSFGRNSVQTHYELGYSFRDHAPVERWFRLGGFGRLSGLIPGELSGRHFGLAGLAYKHRLNDSDLFRLYAGATLEAGNTWELKKDIQFDSLRYSGSIFLGVDSFIGPIFLSWGANDGGENTLYFYLGNPFRIQRF